MIGVWACAAVIGIPCFTLYTARDTRLTASGDRVTNPSAYISNAYWLAALPAAGFFACLLLNVRREDRALRQAKGDFRVRVFALVLRINFAEGVRLMGPRAQAEEYAACEAAQGKGGSPVADHNPAEGRHRFPIMPPRLSGEGATTPTRTDGYLYLTIRNGAALMSGYSQALDNDEMWGIVAYIRTLDGAQYTGN
jgi:hypothetical protein